MADEEKTGELESILSEYDQSNADADAREVLGEQKQRTAADLGIEGGDTYARHHAEGARTPVERVTELEQFSAEVLKWQAREDEARSITAAVDSLAETLGQDVPRGAIKGMLHAAYVADPKFAEAFNNRHANPRGWTRALAHAGKDIRAEFDKIPDKDATEDREAVAFYVRGASAPSAELSEAEQAREMAKMSDAELRKHIEDKYGFTPAL